MDGGQCENVSIYRLNNYPLINIHRPLSTIIMHAIRTENLTKRFGSIMAVDALTLQVAEGEIFGLVGPDGAGKTTTMRLLTTIMEPTSGEAWIAGLHIGKDAEAIKENIGYMSQRFGLYPDLTVMENLDFYADIYSEPRKSRQAKIERLLAFSNLAPFKRRLAGNLSGGMKQKLALACALIHTPKVLFLDEPTNGVDPVSRRDFWRILYSLLREKVTIFVSTAYLDEAERCNRVALIDRGKMLACGTPDDVKKLMKGTILEIRCAAPLRGQPAQGKINRRHRGFIRRPGSCRKRSSRANRIHGKPPAGRRGIAH